MKTHTSSFKEQIKLIGKEIDSRITFGSTVLGKNDLNAVTPSYQGAILKSVMKQLDIDSNVEIPIGTILKYEFGLKVNGEYEYINYGNYVVYSVEKQEDTKSYKITCYDKLLYSMLDYAKLPITYPISIRDYINSISTVLGLKFANKSETFANYNKQIQADLYDGLGYTFRDILDELAQVTASTICLNNNDELEIRYITETGDTIDEEFLKDVNVNFGEKFGAVNTIVLSRSADSDSVYYPSTLPANPYEIKISDNQIMNGNDRADFLPDIYNKLNGLEFYTNDFVSTGICYYDLCDRYSVKVGDNTYSCVMFNDEVLVTQGLEENIYTELPEQTETDYKHASKDDRMINQVYIIAKKNEAEILALVSTTETIQKEINPTKDESGSEIIIEDASENPLTYLEIDGRSTQDGTPTPETPVEIESVGYENLFDIDTFKSLNSNNAFETYNGIECLKLQGKTIDFSFDSIENMQYTFRFKFIHKTGGDVGAFYFVYDDDTISEIKYTGQMSESGAIYSKTSDSGKTVVAIRWGAWNANHYIYIDKNSVQLEEGTIEHPYIPFGKSGIEVETVGKNIASKSYINGDNLYININKNAITSKTMTIQFITDVSLSYNSLYLHIDETSSFLIAMSGLANTVNSITITLKDEQYSAIQSASSVYFHIYKAGAGFKLFNNVQVENGDTLTNYQPYQKNISVMELNAPLRSLPNGVKDIAYIKNNKLYVDRYVGSVVFNGNEDWIYENSVSSPTERTVVRKYFVSTNNNAWLSNRFIMDTEETPFDGNILTIRSDVIYLSMKDEITGILSTDDNATKLSKIKTYLSTHNTEVQYELATPVTEELGEIEMLKTLKGYNNISTTDDLLPIINLTYVRDTILADYVENHVAELKLTESEIKASVESVSSSVDGLNTTINRVEEITNDNSQVINIISTNIDRTTGEVREVTTTNGFTFNSEGMNIYVGENSYNTQINNIGTFYRDGGEIIGQTSKDGSILKDLKTQGQSQYSYDGDSYDFIEERVEVDGEYCYATFYNGEE